MRCAASDPVLLVSGGACFTHGTHRGTKEKKPLCAVGNTLSREALELTEFGMERILAEPVPR
jgi:hypothetical protein